MVPKEGLEGRWRNWIERSNIKRQLNQETNLLTVYVILLMFLYLKGKSTLTLTCVIPARSMVLSLLQINKYYSLLYRVGNMMLVLVKNAKVRHEISRVGLFREKNSYWSLKVLRLNRCVEESWKLSSYLPSSHNEWIEFSMIETHTVLESLNLSAQLYVSQPKTFGHWRNHIFQPLCTITFCMLKAVSFSSDQVTFFDLKDKSCAGQCLWYAESSIYLLISPFLHFAKFEWNFVRETSSCNRWTTIW